MLSSEPVMHQVSDCLFYWVNTLFHIYIRNTSYCIKTRSLILLPMKSIEKLLQTLLQNEEYPWI